MNGDKRLLLAAVLDACAQRGGGHVVAGDVLEKNLTYRQLFTRAFILASKLHVILSVAKDPLLRPEDPSALPQDDNRYIGLLLPNTLAALLAFVALHMQGKVPAMLNYSSGESNVLHACRIARIQTVLTSRAFIERAKLENIAMALEKEHQLFYLEDIRPHITWIDKLKGFVCAFFPRMALRGVLSRVLPQSPAVILYTSGSEGAPKGVALSHANILANIGQVLARLTFNKADIVFNALPVFHSFGLTVGMLMPLVHGLKTFLYPSPVQYKQIPKEVKGSGATIMLGTDTFYQGYARYAEAGDFANVHLAVAGAEKLKESTRRVWEEKLGVHIFEGYGVTESSPVVAVNIPGEEKNGTVGKLFPGMDYKLEAVQGLEKGGRLFIKGPNIMLGYLKSDQPGVIQPQGEWYDTGDIVDVDVGGFITILGRAKRFAKIAGEMVSLLAVEELAALVSPEAAHAAIAIADPSRGEQILLISEDKALTRDILIERAKVQGIAEIMLPKRVVHMEAIPRLGNGKIDYMSLAKASI